MKTEYITSTEALGVRFISTPTKAKDKHIFECIQCDHQWQTTPLAVRQIHSKYQTNSCPTCNQSRRGSRYAEKQAAALARIPVHVKVLSEWSGTQNFIDKETSNVTFHNTKCGHIFECNPNYILKGKSECPICGDIKRTTKRNINNHLRKVHDPESWKRYQNDCQYMSTKTYNANEAILNPNSYLRALAGVEGGYQLDHILPKAIGYKLDIPPELMSHIDNLQVIPWEENRQHSDKIKYIPLIFREFFI